MFPDSNRRQTSLEKLKPKRHSAKALRLLPSILRGNKSIFHMTLSARGVLWLFLTIAVPAGAAHLTCTVFQPRWQTAFSQGCFRGGEASPGLAFLGRSACSRGCDGGNCNVHHVAPRSTAQGSVVYSSRASGFRHANHQYNRLRCSEGWSALPSPTSFLLSQPPGRW